MSNYQGDDLTAFNINNVKKWANIKGEKMKRQTLRKVKRKNTAFFMCHFSCKFGQMMWMVIRKY
jgi:hypothetical protein